MMSGALRLNITVKRVSSHVRQIVVKGISCYLDRAEPAVHNHYLRIICLTRYFTASDMLFVYAFGPPFWGRFTAFPAT